MQPDESRMDRIERALEALAASNEVQRVNIESLHSSVSELHQSAQRHDAQIAALIEASRQDGENIRALARIAEMHQRRIEDLEGGRP